MIPRTIRGANVTFTAPREWDEERNGRCVPLRARVVDGTISTAWEPTPEELKLLNEGGSVVLTIWGGPPPVWIGVEPSVQEDEER